ncbi:MAG: RagB/SusD family nutrient uptake outer membrane protein [Bacteroidales bacterium]|nr:RagB/SusD family nutrient uptake outer membrane protein [Bacteroidales bacterium]
MKKSIILIIAAAALTISGCDYLLREHPETSVSTQTAYGTEEALESQIIGCYRMLGDVKLYMGHMQEEIHTASYIAAAGKNLQDNGTLSIVNLTKYTNRVYMYNLYTNLYIGVNKCNILIDNLPGSPVAQSYKDEIEGEARFLRAVLYFTLVRIYGDVPLWLHPATSQDDVYLPRAPYQKVYKQILSDLIWAEKHMRDAGRAEQIGGVGNGRVNKWAATAYKSSVYIQIACLMEFKQYQFFDYKKEGREPDFSDENPDLDIPNAKSAWRAALEACESVINSGTYMLADHYAKLFRWSEPEDWTLKERIFCLQCNDKVTGPLISLWSLPPFPEGTANTETANSNWGKFRPSRFLYQKWAETYGGTKGTSVGKNDNIYVSCKDPRFDITFIHNGYLRQDTQMTQEVYPAAARVLSHDATSFMPYFRKYLCPSFNASTGDADFYMMRYAEVFLNAAEACAALCEGPADTKWQDALGYIEVLHERARKSVGDQMPVSEYPKWEEGRFANKDELIDAIMWERHFELCGEGHEYFDTHRRGAKFMLEHICIPVNAHLQAPEQADFWANDASQQGYWSTVYYGKLAPDTIQKCRQSIICEFPEMEMRYNTAISYLDQNDYTWN